MQFYLSISNNFSFYNFSSFSFTFFIPFFTPLYNEQFSPVNGFFFSYNFSFNLFLFLYVLIFYITLFFYTIMQVSFSLNLLKPNEKKTKRKILQRKNICFVHLCLFLFVHSAIYLKHKKQL